MRVLNFLLTIQEMAGLLSLIGAIIVVAVVLFVISSGGAYEDKHEVKKKVYKARKQYFFVLSALVVIMLFTSLQYTPYNHKDNPDITVAVVGMQWTWKMQEGTSLKPEDVTGSNEIKLPAHKSIRFDATSIDVNHNFAIYNSKGDLVAQTQAMPSYTNSLLYTFDEPGEYTILCLEYCGMPHGYMTGKIHIQ